MLTTFSNLFTLALNIPCLMTCQEESFFYQDLSKNQKSFQNVYFGKVKTGMQAWFNLLKTNLVALNAFIHLVLVYFSSSFFWQREVNTIVDWSFPSQLHWALSWAKLLVISSLYLEPIKATASWEGILSTVTHVLNQCPSSLLFLYYTTQQGL